MKKNSAQFVVEVTPQQNIDFANISGDWNPLHTNPEHAAKSAYKKPVLHGAYSAGLISRLAGMYLPGEACLLHDMRLRFIAPIIPPARLNVVGALQEQSSATKRVEATIQDADTGLRYVEASYGFSLHTVDDTIKDTSNQQNVDKPDDKKPRYLVTGGSGGIGSAVLELLANRAFAISYSDMVGDIDDWKIDFPIAGIIHCGSPKPDNEPLLDIADPGVAINHHISAPLIQIQKLASLLNKQGVENAPLILVGSTAAQPGRHSYRMPLYSLTKSLIPTLVRIFALELAINKKRCFGVAFDVVDGGINQGMSTVAKLTNADRSAWGVLATPKEVAEQIEWMVDNNSYLVSGCMVTLTGGAIG
ncbi:MAG: SDR family oxidoreductase [Magnetococcales bacterium]|nr:SDR family oxidoreductase [Magnetococcales bacterium]